VQAAHIVATADGRCQRSIEGPKMEDILLDLLDKGASWNQVLVAAHVMDSDGLCGQEGPCFGTTHNKLYFRDYVNGAPCFLPDSSEDLGNGTVVVLARYDDTGLPAAVRVSAGQGVAVLCGSHPELDPSWLADPRWDDARLKQRVGGVEDNSDYKRGVRYGLEGDDGANARKREEFLRVLLQQVGVL
jgi:Biotin-protein ligase, N terminal